MVYPRLIPAGDAGWTAEFGDIIAPAVNDRVLAFAQAVEAWQEAGIVEIVPAYCAKTVYFDPLAADAMQLSVA